MIKKMLGWTAQAVAVTGVLAACGAETAAPGPGGSAGSWGTAPVAGGAAPTTYVPTPTAGGRAVGVVAGSTGSVPTPGVGVAGAGGGDVGEVASDLPCEVSRALQSGCQSCHGAVLAFGAPMPLVTYGDLMKPSAKNPSMTVGQSALVRLNDTASPMPPASANKMLDTDKQALKTYLTAGVRPATAAEAVCAPVTGGTEQPRVPHDADYFKNGLTPLPGETCYELPVHGANGAADRSKFAVAPGEHYHQFYFKMPWGSDMLMTRFGTKFDNLKVVHHWLLFNSNRPLTEDGTIDRDVTGTTLGDSSELLAGWAVGGDHVTFPSDTGLELGTGKILNAQWHYFNQGTTTEQDSSVIQVCAVPKAMRTNIASLTFLGTENFNGPIGMPAKTKSEFKGTCTNNSGAPVSIYGFTPHMHELGINMKAEVVRKGSQTKEVAFDKPFDFNAQITYILDDLIVLQPGDSIISTCTFNNHTDRSVAFGQSTKQEMCYNFTMAYPARKLDNATPSLIGATNVCW